MVNRHHFGYALVALVVVSLGCVALVGFESSFLPKNTMLAESQRTEATNMMTVQESAGEVLEPAQGVQQSDDTLSASASRQGQDDSSASSSEESSSTFDDSTNETRSSSSSAEISASASQSEDPSEAPGTAPSTAPSEGMTADADTSEPTKSIEAKPRLRREAEVEETEVDEKEATEAPRVAMEEDDTEPLAQFDIEELMTPELIARIENEKHNPLAPMHVHMLWIGDLSRAPRERQLYSDFGYELIVHTDPEEILEGFHPHVLKAFKLAIPAVVGYDFLKFAMLYKYGGLSVDADTTPAIFASTLRFPSDCDLVLGKELQLRQWQRTTYRQVGSNTYGMNRPFQILNWAMAARKPRNPHVKWLMRAAMMHFFGLRDMELSLVQDISGSGLMSDYVALLHEQEGRSYPEVYRDESKYYPVQGLCLTDGYLYGGWIRHAFHGSWKPRGHQ